MSLTPSLKSSLARRFSACPHRFRSTAAQVGILAACGYAEGEAVRKPKVTVLLTGDELTAPGNPLAPAHVYDSNGAIIAVAVKEAGGSLRRGVFPDKREAALKHARALHRRQSARKSARLGMQPVEAWSAALAAKATLIA